MEPSAKLPVSIGLTQRNLHRAHEYLDSVSNPSSKDYGRHWSINEVTDTFAPSEESRHEVLQWLSDNGISTVKDGGALHTVDFDLPVSEVERLLKTEYWIYEHDASGEAHMACEEYSVPEHLTRHINIITPTLHFDVKPTRHLKKREWKNPADPLTGSHPYHEEYQEGPHAQADEGDLQKCDDAITPDCLRAIYNIPQASDTPCEENSFGILEYSPNTYVPEDLDIFFSNYSTNAIGARPLNLTENGGTLDFSDPSDFNLHGESNLDFQVAMALTYPQNVTLYEVGASITQTASDINFVKTNVLSVSWGFDETDLTPAYMELLCNEYMKLGLQGISVIYSSGDGGVGGSDRTCPEGRFVPDFPASCPYVTAVGATQLDTSIDDYAAALENGEQIEVAINSNVISGGGFSDVFTIPDYQKDVVSSYLSNNATSPPYSGSVYNNSGNARAYPDISANGHNYAVIVGGTQQSVDGTSASAPTFASMITLINEERIKAGKSAVGFLNPVLYQNADAIVKDVVSGNNAACNTTGFATGEGWDPVTGLGTPKYDAMLDVFMSLD
jgi:tripeptidyl-peptidase-1